MKTDNKTVELPAAEKPTVYERIKETLAVASQIIITAPIKLPPKVVPGCRKISHHPLRF